RRLYSGEDDYSGLGALDPANPDVLYISTDADPVKGTPLISAADGKRHYELFRAERGANGKWSWTPFTRNSTYDNLRPVIPQWNDPRRAIVWVGGASPGNQGEWYSWRVAAMVRCGGSAIVPRLAALASHRANRDGARSAPRGWGGPPLLDPHASPSC